MGEINIRQIRITENLKDIVLIAQQINEIIGYIHGRPNGHRFYQIYRYINNKKENNFIRLFD